MKILFLSHKFYPDIGGIEVNSEILANEFVKAGHDVTLLTWSAKEGDKKFSFKIIRRPSISKLFSLHFWADVVYENNPCLRMSWPNFFVNKKSVIALRTWVHRADGTISWQDRLKYGWLKKAKSVIAVSESVRKKCWPDAVVIGNPYREHLFIRETRTSQFKDFIFLGRLVVDKGAHLAIQAFHKLLTTNDRYTNLKLTIVGDGPEKPRLIELVNTLELSHSVIFTGSLSGSFLVRELNEHKYLLVPSIWEEPFGNVALEGLACGCIPIVADSGGLPDAVGKAGLVVKRNDLEDLYLTMIRIIEDEGLQISLKGEAHEHLKRHKPSYVANEYLKVICQ